MYKKISIIGAGGWGTALALLLAENRTAVRLWAHNPEVTKELVSQRTNEDYLPGVRLPPNVYATGIWPIPWMPISCFSCRHPRLCAKCAASSRL